MKNKDKNEAEQLAKNVDFDPNVNYYEILELPDHASLDEIERAHDVLTAKWDPKRYRVLGREVPHKGIEQYRHAEEKYYQIKKAYWFLSNPKNRLVYVPPKKHEHKSTCDSSSSSSTWDCREERGPWKKVKVLVEIFLVLAFAAVLAVAWLGMQGKLDPYIYPANCTDGTLRNACSIEKPLFCYRGKLIENSSKCGCENDLRPYRDRCIEKILCDDGSLWPDCSQNKPYQCARGILVSNATVCGCPENYSIDGDGCKFIERCADGTIYDRCSRNQPLRCENGALVERASMCGCPEGLVIESFGNTNGEKCVINRAFNAPADSGSTNIANIYDIETRIHILINAQRNANGLPSLNFDEKLASIARKHSQDMAARGYFEHDTPEGHDFYWRMQQDGYNCAIEVGNTIYQGAENIFNEYGYATDSVASNAVEGWMSSSGHRANILTQYWKNEGVGVAQAKDGTVYITQDFC